MRPAGTREFDYGLRTMMQLASVGARVKAADIAGAGRIPEGTLRHVLQQLQRANLISALPSRTGGFTLARPPEQITVLDVAEALEGPLRVSECVFGLGPCAQADQCAVHRTWAAAWSAMRGELACATIADLVSGGGGGDPSSRGTDSPVAPAGQEV